MRVGNNAISTNTKPARYFAQIISHEVSGLVFNNSIVPVLFSSEKDRIVTAGIKIRNTQGAIVKSESRLA